MLYNFILFNINVWRKRIKMADNFLKNDKLSKKMLIQHPGEDDSTDFYKDLDTEPLMTL